MTPEEVRARAELAGNAGIDDPEAGHIEEDRLHCDVLRFIAASSSEHAPLAAAALLTDEWDFPRWCA